MGVLMVWDLEIFSYEVGSMDHGRQEAEREGSSVTWASCPAYVGLRHHPKGCPVHRLLNADGGTWNQWG